MVLPSPLILSRPLTVLSPMLLPLQTPEQFAGSLDVATKLGLNGVVIIGGDDSNVRILHSRNHNAVPTSGCLRALRYVRFHRCNAYRSRESPCLPACPHTHTRVCVQTNAAVLAEYFAANNAATKVIGCPKTIDGDLKVRAVWLQLVHRCW